MPEISNRIFARFNYRYGKIKNWIFFKFPVKIIIYDYKRDTKVTNEHGIYTSYIYFLKRHHEK